MVKSVVNEKKEIGEYFGTNNGNITSDDTKNRTEWMTKKNKQKKMNVKRSV